VTDGRRARLATAVVRSINWGSRTLGRGSGTVIGGRAGLALDSQLLRELSQDRIVALVSGTNGKTTTTRMLAVAIAHRLGPIATNATGANMPAGHVAALVADPTAPTAVLEVDEGYVDRMLEEVHPSVVVLLNLSRDQLDRVAEVRLVAERWRRALSRLTDGAEGDLPAPVVVANADDPLVAWAAAAAPSVRWVGAGLVWHEDAVGCPACGGGIVFGPLGAWACDRCDLRRPDPDVWLDGDVLVSADGSQRSVDLRVPGWFNRANAAMAVVAACLLTGDDARSVGTECAASAVDRIASISSVEGRFGVVHRRGRDVRLVLAKNPAGWAAVFDLLEGSAATGEGPVVLSINARTADGLDPSWLWDVPFERLVGRVAVATGDRHRDLAVRLRYAEVEHEVVADPLAALDRAVDLVPPTTADAIEETETLFIGNYTAFADVRRRLR
jgi:lipid II isoglutaminyl synthase (glutamine-hydrolysing)